MKVTCYLKEVDKNKNNLSVEKDIEIPERLLPYFNHVKAAVVVYRGESRIKGFFPQIESAAHQGLFGDNPLDYYDASIESAVLELLGNGERLLREEFPEWSHYVEITITDPNYDISQE